MTSRRKARRFRLNEALPNPTPDFVAVGRLRRPHGVQGELLFEVWTDFPERLQPGITLYVGARHRPMHLLARRDLPHGLLLTLEGIHDRDQAGLLRNQVVYVPAASLPPLEDGDWYVHQVLGLHVVTDEGQPLGVLVEVFETGANDVLVVRRPDGSEALLPATDEVVLQVDFDHRTMTVHLLPGLLE